MAEVRTGEFSKYTNSMVDDLRSLKAWVWDTGPDEPDMPEAPEPPQGKEGDPKFDLARLQYKRALKHYEDALLKFEQDFKDWQTWHTSNGGPVELLQWSVDMFDTIRYDLRAVFEKRQAKPRYYISRRTNQTVFNRVSGAITEALKREKIELNLTTGLPKGMKPGHAHQANLERQIAGEQEFVEALRNDPQFGQELRK